MVRWGRVAFGKKHLRKWQKVARVNVTKTNVILANSFKMSVEQLFQKQMLFKLKSLEFILLEQILKKNKCC